MKKYENWRKKQGLKKKTGWLVPLQKQYARPMALGCIAGFLFQLVYFAQVTFFGLYFAKELNMSQELIGLATLPIMGTGAIAAFLAGPILDRWGRLPTVRLASYIMLAGITLDSFPAVFVTGDLSNPLLQCITIIGNIFGAFSIGLLIAGLIIMPLEMLPTHIRSTAMGWISAMNRGAVIVAPFLVMYGAEKLGGLGLSYQYMFILMLLPYLTAAFTMYMLAPEGKGRELEEIVVSEVYTKRKIRDKKNKEKYFLFAIAFTSFIGFGFIYGQTTNETLSSIALMLGLYSILSLICFAIIVYVREKVM